MTSSDNSSTPTPRTGMPRTAIGALVVLAVSMAAMAAVQVAQWIKPSTPTAAAVAAASAPASAVVAMNEASAAGNFPPPVQPQGHANPQQQRGTANSNWGGQRPSPVVSGRTTPAVNDSVRTVCASCGTVESSVARRRDGEAKGGGAVIGGVLGAAIGNQMGNGNGKAAMTVLGAIGGGVAGNTVEKRMNAETVFDVTVRFDDGTVRHFQSSQGWAPGSRVHAEGNGLRPLQEPQGNSSYRNQQRDANT